jgi:hypothetical protein
MMLSYNTQDSAKFWSTNFILFHHYNYQIIIIWHLKCVLRVFSGGKVRPGRDADPSPPSSAEVKNRVDIPLLSLRAFVAYEKMKPT